eukprot:gene16065-19053_t
MVLRPGVACCEQLANELTGSFEYLDHADITRLSLQMGMLDRAGWAVERPDTHVSKATTWTEYCEWVTQQSRKGVAVLELHGQGTGAACQGVTIGMIGQPEAPLNACLAREFGTFPISWKTLAVPRNGGVVLEAFNTDKTRMMLLVEGGLLCGVAMMETNSELDAIWGPQVKRLGESTDSSMATSAGLRGSATGCPLSSFEERRPRK